MNEQRLVSAGGSDSASLPVASPRVKVVEHGHAAGVLLNEVDAA